MTDAAKYWVIYRHWEDTGDNMGGGYWETTFKRFHTLVAAQEWITALEHDPNCDVISAPLTPATP